MKNRRINFIECLMIIRMIKARLVMCWLERRNLLKMIPNIRIRNKISKTSSPRKITNLSIRKSMVIHYSTFMPMNWSTWCQMMSKFKKILLAKISLKLASTILPKWSLCHSRRPSSYSSSKAFTQLLQKLQPWQTRSSTFTNSLNHSGTRPTWSTLLNFHKF